MISLQNGRLQIISKMFRRQFYIDLVGDLRKHGEHMKTYIAQI